MKPLCSFCQQLKRKPLQPDSIPTTPVQPQIMDTSADRVTSFDDLEMSCLIRVFAFLTAEQCAKAASVHSLWNVASGDDTIWKAHLARDFACSNAENADGTQAQSFRAAYGNWMVSYADVKGPFLSRALAMWSSIKAWLAANSPQILATLKPGATPEQLLEAEAALGHKLPESVRCIYRVCNGQELNLETSKNESDKPPPHLLMGLFGTLMFYDHVTSNAMLSLNSMVTLTQFLRSVRPMGARHPIITAKQVIYAHSFKQLDKICLVDADTGMPYMKLHEQVWPLAPVQDSSSGAADGLLRWMEEYARRLTAGWYKQYDAEHVAQGYLDGMGVQFAGAISLFPRAYPAAATAITRGVKVTWSSVFVPQESRLAVQGPSRLMFTYNVTFALLTPEQEAAATAQLEQERRQWEQQQQQQSPAAAVAGGGRNVIHQRVAVGSCDASAGTACVPDALAAPPSLTAAAAAPAGDAAASSSSSSVPISSSCQLETRNWIILDAQGNQTDNVSGEGVIGLYPLLVPGAPEFSYASCTPFSVAGGREHRPAAAAAGGALRPEQLVGRVFGGMEGGFDFVEGSMMQKSGPSFVVKCPRLVFAVPEYLY